MKAMQSASITSFVKTVLDVCWWLAAIGLGLAVLLLCLSMFAAPDILHLSVPVSFDLDLRAHSVAVPSTGIEGARIQRAQGNLSLPVQRGWFLFANIVVLIVLMAVALWVLSQLRAVFRTLRDGRPFVSENVRRIRWVGVGVILGAFAGSAVTLFNNYYTMTHFASDTVRFVARPTVDVVAIVHGLVILAIAEVFKAGVRLEEDQSLTV